ncbi:unnamed protein product [Linum trigynum]|uniref:CCHC-type domain-containing protein n=1 Tax=Linum trigynum TaxID=586398 RepID=A0AAV2FQK4_9ROSI
MAHVTSDQVVQFSMEEVQSTKYRASHSLLGRVFISNRISMTELRDSVITPWLIQGRLGVVLAKHGLVEFMLPSKEAKIWVLKRTPWVINDQIIHLRPWTLAITKQTFDDLAIAPFPIQLWDVEEDCCTQQFGRKMVSAKIGKVLETSVFACQDTGSWFVKVKVLVDFTKPLRSQIMATNDDTGCFWVSLKYEYLPSFCYKCGRVSHSLRACTFDPPARKEKCGPHMATRKLGTRIYDTEESNLVFPRGANTVWIKKSYRDPKGRKDESSFAHGGEIQEPTLQSQPRQHPVPPRKVALPAPMGSQRRQSPRGFRVTRSPNLMVGRAARPTHAQNENFDRVHTITRSNERSKEGDRELQGRKERDGERQGRHSQ